MTDTFTTGSGGAYTLSLADLNASGLGNDFTLDDISLVQAPVFTSQNLIVNGDFAAGTTGFGSDYTLVSANAGVFTLPGDYAIATNPATDFTNQYSSYGDHTSGGGNMLMVDGRASGAFWRESVALAPNTTYRFTYYVTGAGPLNLPDVQVSLNGVAIDAGFQVSGAGGVWQQVTDVFTTGGDGGPYVLSMADLSDIGEGNDFTIDDIALNEAACYLRGTGVATTRGEIAIENLAVGDLVLTASGAPRPVVWVGRRRIEVSRHPDPAAVQPVLIRAGAFAEGLPRRDLWVSPGHNIACDGVLIPAAALVNGRSVVQVPKQRVEYWHVELETHDVILAQGLPAESYLDTGNRAAFENGGAFIEAHPDLRPRHWAQTCLPLALEGPAVSAAKARLLARLAERGARADADADVHVRADGARIEPIWLTPTRLLFALPASARAIELRSRTFIPAHTQAAASDPRTLGLCVGALQIDGSPVPLEGEMAAGWREAEFEAGRFTHRWTDGATPLPPGARIVVVDLAGVGCYWSQPHEGLVELRA